MDRDSSRTTGGGGRKRDSSDSTATIEDQVNGENVTVSGADASTGSATDRETVSLAEAVDRHDAVALTAEDVGSDVIVWEDTTVVEIVAEVIEYFRTAELDADFADPPDEAFVADQFFDFEYLEHYEEVERTWLQKPFAYASILYDPTENEHLYHVSEPTLDAFERFVQQDLVALLRDNLLYRDFDGEQDRETLFQQEARTLILDHAATVDDGSLHKLLYYLLRDFIHYGPIDPMMRDGAIEDISCDGTDVPIFVYHRDYRDLKTNVSFSRERLDSFTFRLAQRSGKQMTVSSPLVDASLPNGSRVQLTLGGEVSTRGSNFTIRKFADVPYTPVDLITSNTFSVEQMAYFWLAIENNKSLIFAGGTGSGKTSSMNAVSFFIPPRSKVVSIEDTREIDLPHENWIQSVSRGGASADGRGDVSMFELLQAALRQRPEYLLVGEIRTEERVALTFFQAMSTGHTAYTTLHADTVETAMSRLRNPPLNVPVQMLQDLDIVSIQSQAFVDDRRVRRNRTVAEIEPGADDSTIDVEPIFSRDAASDTHERVGESRVLADIAEDRGWSAERLQRELEDRETVLGYLSDHGITGYDEVARAIHLYSRDPDRILAEVESAELDRQTLLDTGPDIDEISPTELGASDGFLNGS
ncbi:type II/IV secretion system ATPase subunit [Halorientalis halophila]|uniref:type II/IV secretion system ATPase subunit n=1 Tax=Halorientalis halophila TaxID=3108499 RepID=UPI003AB703F0